MKKSMEVIGRIGPFITQMAERSADGKRYLISSWRLRHGLHPLRFDERGGIHRPSERLALLFIVRPELLTWWVGTLFMIGSLFFTAGSLMILLWSQRYTADTINLVYFIGSIFFTTAAYGQLLQAINANIATRVGWSAKKKSWRWWARGLQSAGFMAAGSQFIGTILFNINTFDAWHGAESAIGKHLFIWAPNMMGSVLFMISSFFAWIEIYRDDFVKPFRSLAWWAVWSNILGSIFFQISAIYAWISPLTGEEANGHLSIVFTLLGAICFFLGAYISNLQLKENEKQMDTDQNL